MTSQDAIAEFSEFLYTAILWTATSPNFKFKSQVAPFPVVALQKQWKAEANSFMMAFIFAIAFALIPVTIISYLINERWYSLKHQ